MPRATNPAQSTSASGTTQSLPSDTTPPTISLTAPSPGATLTGSTTVSANASDNVGVVGVRFLLDGVDLAAEDTTSPFDVTWSTTGTPNGTHILTARARDAAGNTTTSAPVSVTVSNVTSPPAGIVAGYAFDDGSGTSAADASGHGITGTLTNGPAWAAGRYGGAISLDGNDDYVDLGNPTALRLTGSMTVSAWINSSSFPADDASVVSKRGSIGFQLDTTLDGGPRTVGFKLTSSTGADMIRYGATALQTNTWYHVAGVYDAAAGTMTVYLNGQVDAGAQVGTITSTQQDSPENVRIGRRANGGYLFNGRVDDVRIYDRALSATEIQADMAHSLGPPSGDTTPPSVSLTAPAAGAQVADIVNVTADATDDVGVQGVQFYVDGVATGAEDGTAPYGLAWDTRATTNGAHTLTARARDAAGNSTLSVGVAVNVTNANFFQNEVLATGFNLPTNIEFLPDGRMLVVELAGKIWVLPPPYRPPIRRPSCRSPTSASAACSRACSTSPSTPTFATNHYYYVFYTLGSPNRDRLSRFTANAVSPGRSPAASSCSTRIPQNANDEHHGGAIKFGNDGKLYFTTGEHFDSGHRPESHEPTRQGPCASTRTARCRPTTRSTTALARTVDSIWALGLRNPYRAFYDIPTGRSTSATWGQRLLDRRRGGRRRAPRAPTTGGPTSKGPCPAPLHEPALLVPAQRARRGHHGRVRLPRHAVSRQRTRATTSSPTTRRTGSAG